MPLIESPDVHRGDFAGHPYPTLNRLREAHPVFWHEGLGAFWVLRFDDVRAVLSDERRFVPELPVPPQPDRRMITQMNGSEHRRHRAIVNPAFALGVLRRSVEPAIRPLADELVAGFVQAEKVELVSEFANPIPARIMRAILQIPDLDTDSFMRDFHLVLEWIADPTGPAAFEAPAAHARRLEEIRRIVDADRLSPQGGMISDLFDSEVDGQKLSDEDVAQFSMALLVAGIETTQRLIANLVYALCRFPQQMAALGRDRALLPAAIEEALRYFPPNQFRMRVAVADTELGGVAIRAGSVLYAMTGSANRDPRAFERPDEFDITRQLWELRHVSFGYGPHHCIGAHLARLETFHAVSCLLDNTRDLRLDPARVPEFSGFRNRSPESLWLQFGAA